MPKIRSRVTFNKAAAAALIKAASDRALTDMGMQALKDTEDHVPRDSEGTLKDSGITHSDRRAENGKFMMRWSTPYAQYLWHGKVMYGNPTDRDYGPKKISFTSALARMEWAKYAREVYGENWKKVYQESLRKGMKG